MTAATTDVSFVLGSDPRINTNAVNNRVQTASPSSLPRSSWRG